MTVVSGLHNCLEFSQRLSCLHQAVQTQKTFSIAYIYHAKKAVKRFQGKPGLLYSLYSGGLTNELYICSLPNYCPVINKEKRKVLLRIYGPLYSELVSSSSALIYNIVIFTLLSEREVGPKLYAVFPRGRLEELLPVSFCI